MEKIITKTNETTTGTLKNFSTVIFDFDERDISMGMSFDTRTFTGHCSFTEALSGATDQQKNIIKAFFRKIKRICFNDGVNPDTPIVDGDITEEME